MGPRKHQLQAREVRQGWRKLPQGFGNQQQESCALLLHGDDFGSQPRVPVGFEVLREVGVPRPQERVEQVPEGQHLSQAIKIRRGRAGTLGVAKLDAQRASNSHASRQDLQEIGQDRQSSLLLLTGPRPLKQGCAKDQRFYREPAQHGQRWRRDGPMIPCIINHNNNEEGFVRNLRKTHTHHLEVFWQEDRHRCQDSSLRPDAVTKKQEENEELY